MARVIAIVGAESTGKSTLAQALAQALRERHSGQRVAVVHEWLREWCAANGRTPLAHEQAAILRGQQERIDSAAATHDAIVADTTPLMVAAYSAFVFNDFSLRDRALQLHARCVHTTLLSALDLPWVADGHQRDGAHVREPVDALLRQWLSRAGIGFAVIHGTGPARLANALAAVAASAPQAANAATPNAGLFTRLGQRGGAAGWLCECCLPGAR